MDTWEDLQKQIKAEHLAFEEAARLVKVYRESAHQWRSVSIALILINLVTVVSWFAMYYGG